MAMERDTMTWPAIALVASQVVHGVIPVDKHHVNNEGYTGLVVGAILLALSVAALMGIVQHRPYGRPMAAWTGVAVAVGFVAYHAVPWTSIISNPYLGQPVGAPAWISVALAVGSGAWCGVEGRAVLLGRDPRTATAV